MANLIKLKRSATSGNNPTTSNLELGELAINTYDGNLFFKKSVSGTESILSVATLTGTQTLTNKTISGNSNTLILKNSSTLGAEPLTSDIQYGEVVLNYTDGRLYFKTSTNAIDYFDSGIGSGVAGDTFKTIAIAGQTSVVAESPSDTLTIVAGGVISILTDAINDTITITTSRSFPFIKSSGVETTIPLRVEDSALANSLDTVYLPFIKSSGSSVTTLKLVA